jgi:ketosteroid isomerase-like protein
VLLPFGPAKGGGVSATDDTRAIVKAYYRGWTTKNFSEATRLLGPALKVEVPINEYPTTASFAQAVTAFGGMTTSVELLAEFAEGEEAMLLYDMDVEGLGVMRVAEHFTVADGRITRIRQIHDTAALRAAGFAPKA